MNTVALLERVRNKPLDEIDLDDAGDLVKEVMEENDNHVTVDVAKFGSSI